MENNGDFRKISIQMNGDLRKDQFTNGIGKISDEKVLALRQKNVGLNVGLNKTEKAVWKVKQ